MFILYRISTNAEQVKNHFLLVVNADSIVREGVGGVKGGGGQGESILGALRVQLHSQTRFIGEVKYINPLCLDCITETNSSY